MWLRSQVSGMHHCVLKTRSKNDNTTLTEPRANYHNQTNKPQIPQTALSRTKASVPWTSRAAPHQVLGLSRRLSAVQPETQFKYSGHPADTALLARSPPCSFYSLSLLSDKNFIIEFLWEKNVFKQAQWSSSGPLQGEEVNTNKCLVVKESTHLPPTSTGPVFDQAHIRANFNPHEYDPRPKLRRCSIEAAGWNGAPPEHAGRWAEVPRFPEASEGRDASRGRGHLAPLPGPLTRCFCRPLNNCLPSQHY